MAEETRGSLVNFGDYSKPVDTLIKKVSKVVGGILHPYQIVRIAKAEGAASIIRAKSEIQVEELRQRARQRSIEEEVIRQSNMEAITSKAIPYLTLDANPESINDDWMAIFFEKARLVSDKEMQEVWARVLAGEANKAGTYSKRTINFLNDLDKSDADLFTRLCGFVWQIHNPVPIVLDWSDGIYEGNGISFNSLSHLESIGLIRFESTAGYTIGELPKTVVTSYFGQSFTIDMNYESRNVLPVGQVLFTKIGLELSPICGSQPVDGFVEYVNKRWGLSIPTPASDPPTQAESLN